MKSSNKLYKLALPGTLLLVTAAACQHEEIDLYSGPKAGVIIENVSGTDIYGNPVKYVNSKTSSFADVDDDQNAIRTYFEVKLVGDVVDYDRTYSIKVVPDSTTAIQGTEFSIEENEFKIKAGKNKDYVWVTVYRTPNINQNTLRIYFELEENENFRIPISEYKNSSGWSVDGPMYSTKSFEIKFNEIYSMPSYWSNFGNTYLGAWTPEKFKVVNKVMGWKVSDWQYAGSQGWPVQAGRFEPAAYAVRDYLQAMADAGTPVREADGSLMQLPTNYAVDYSAYKDEIMG